MADVDMDMSGRRKARRKMAHGAFLVAIILGALIILLGLSDDAIAKRIAEMAGFLNLYFGGLFSVFAAYMGVGAYENATTIKSVPVAGPGSVAGSGTLVLGGNVVRS